MPTRPRNELKRSYLIAIMVAVLVGYFASSVTLGNSHAIEIGNMMLFSLACGIAVAYTPDATRAFRYLVLDGANVLLLGIWLGWISIAYRTGGTILWRWMDRPDAWLDSVLWGLHLWGSCSSALMHMLGPQAVNGAVPTKQWLKIGFFVTVSLLSVGTIAAISSPRLF